MSHLVKTLALAGRLKEAKESWLASWRDPEAPLLRYLVILSEGEQRISPGLRNKAKKAFKALKKQGRDVGEFSDLEKRGTNSRTPFLFFPEDLKRLEKWRVEEPGVLHNQQDEAEGQRSATPTPEDSDWMTLT